MQQKPDPRQIHRELRELTEDWIHLYDRLPKPIAQDNPRRPKHREYGHPAEWASIKLTQIADLLNGWHSLVATQRKETNAPHVHAAERVKVAKAWFYLETRIQPLIDIVEPDSLTEMATLHSGIRAALGLSERTHTVPIPCPNPECSLRTLQSKPSSPELVCGVCGTTISATEYLDAVIGAR